MKKSIIQKTVDNANASALAIYEGGVANIATSIKQARQNIADAEKRFATEVGAQGTFIAQQQAALAKLAPPTTITAEDIFGAETVANATE